ncbi:MAG: Gfo/Idh/MocA family oxidoreductase, partial [Gammaproteobacteria bacterium]|nr:Gfo/Idh/MocA family oxidoreductase [Gammaproteobacteria bacterium]
MNIGMVGGGMVAIAHLKALESIADVASVFVYTRNPARAAELAKEFSKVCVAESLEILVMNVAGVIIATPNNTHLAVLRDIVSIKPLPVLCEKPLASSCEEGREFYRLAPPLSAVAFNYRFNKVLLSIIDLGRSAELGDILHIDLALNRNSALTKKTIGWRDGASQNKSSGACGDLGSHLLDIICYMTGSEIDRGSLRASLGIRVPMREGVVLTEDDHCIMTGTTDSRAHFKLQVSKSAEDAELGFHAHITFERGEIRYSSRSPDLIALKLMARPGVTEVAIGSSRIIADPVTEVPFWSDSFYFQNEAWVKQIATGSF